MKKYEVIIFDLDGVIINQSIAIMACAKHALLKCGIVENDEKKLLRFIGPTIKDSFMRFYSFDEKKALEAIGYFREMYWKEGIYNYKVYEGINDSLSALKKRGKKIFVATTKPKKSADIILKDANLYSFFYGIYGDTMTFDVTKTSMIRQILKDNGITDNSQVVMIGDREGDINGAKDNNIDSIGVTYGFGTYEELKKAGATYIVSDVKELRELLEK